MLGQVNESIADSIKSEEKYQVKMFVKKMPYYPFCKSLIGRERDKCTSINVPKKQGMSNWKELLMLGLL